MFRNALLSRGLSTLKNKELRESSRLTITLSEIRKEFRDLGSGDVTLTKDDVSGVATLLLDNPERKNSLSGRMMTQFWEAVDELRNWKQAKAVIISGKNGFFCSGGDLNTVRQIADPQNGRKMSLLMHNALTRLQTLPLISLAAIEGMALGGGAEISCACDFRLMTRDARVGFVHVRVGIVSAWGGGARLIQLVGQQRALDLMLSGRVLDREEALRIGLADGELEGVACVEEARDWLERKYSLSEKSCDVICAVKRVQISAKYLPLELALNEEVEASVSVWGARDHLKRLKQNVKHN